MKSETFTAIRPCLDHDPEPIEEGRLIEFCLGNGQTGYLKYDNGKLNIYADNGQLVVRPHVSNCIHIDIEGF